MTTSQEIFRGVYTALVTPFTEQGKVDFDAFERLVETQLEAGIDGLVVLGTTAESPTLTPDEKRQLIEKSVSFAAGKTKVVVGTGTNCTETCIRGSREVTELGVDGLLVVSPYYNKPSQEGLYQHFAAVAEAVSVPLMIYNIQGRTAVNIETETLRRLSQIENIVSVKEASGSLSQMTEVLEHIKATQEQFTVLSGDDAMTFPLMTLGGDGVVSVASNVAPKAMKRLFTLIETGEIAAARELHFSLLPLFRALFCETNPAPAKAVLESFGIGTANVRLPLVPATEEARSTVLDAVRPFSS